MGGAKVEAFRKGELATTTVTDASGHYVMHLVPASYVLKVTNPGLPLLSSEKDVELTKDSVVDLTVDSGIR